MSVTCRNIYICGGVTRDGFMPFPRELAQSKK